MKNKKLDRGIIALKEGYIFDRATGKLVDIRKPEEPVRQEYEKILYEDYGYDYKQMDIETYIQRGSKETEKADIVIYKTTDETKRDQYKDILGIVETKRKEKKDGVKQLTTYMTATSCEWGVWTNGEGIEYLYHDKETGEVKREFIFQIPKKGETFEEIGRISKDKLRPCKNLKPIFRRMLKTLYSNTNISRREKLGNELIRLIFCKIWDEKYEVHLPPKFKIGFKDKVTDVKKRIDELFDEVKSELEHDGVFDKEEEIKLDAKSIAYAVGELEQYSLLKTDKDVIGDAFEVFAESKLVGEKGEFFTPREVVKTAIDIVKPIPGKTVFDPACGSGGFLIYALEYVWGQMENSRKYRGSPNLPQLKRDIAERNFYGIDKEIDLVKIAKAYMAIIGDGRGGIFQENSLHRPEEFQERAKEIFVNKNNKLKKFDIILTNPPFGSKTKILKEDAKIFDLGHKWIFKNDSYIRTDKEKDTPIQELFIERCLEMLEDGGYLAIVLPETYFHAPSKKYILEYIKKNNNIMAVIDLPHNTFRPHNNAKTLLIVLEKSRLQQNKIIFAVAEEMGHNHQGKPIYRYDEQTQKFTQEIWDDLEKIREELNHPDNSNNQYVFVINSKDIKNNLYVPRYYWEKKIKGLEEKAEKLNLKFVSVQELLDKGVIQKFRGHGAPPSEFKGRGKIPYVRAADVISWELYKNPTAMVPYDVYLSVKGKGIDLQPKDIVFVKEGSYRIGDVAMISKFDTGILLNHHSIVFRVIDENNEYGIDAFYLMYLFSHELTQQQFFNKVMIDTTLPNIGDRWKELRLPIAKDKKEIEKIKLNMKKAFEKRWEAQEMINSIRKEFKENITDL